MNRATTFPDSWRGSIKVVLAWESAGLASTMVAAAPLANFHLFVHWVGIGLVFTNGVGLSGFGLFRLAEVAARRWQWRPWARAAAVALGLCLAASLSVLVALRSGRWICSADGWNVDRWHLLLISVNAVALVSAIVISALLLVQGRLVRDLERRVRENEQLERLRVEAQLAMLQSKVNPHFLFNTLNTMIELVHREPQKVERMILGLSEIYRRVLTLSDSATLSLGEELRLVEAYLGIEGIRMGERLAWTIDVPDSVRDTRVPPLAVEVLVENAVQHGLATRKAGGQLWVRAEQQGGAVVIEVADDGVGLGPEEDAGRFGLRSIRERMALLHQDRALLRLEPREGGGTRALLEVPL